MYQDVTAIPGNSYTLKFYTRSHGTGGSPTIKLQYLDASNAAIGTASTYTVTNSSAWSAQQTLTLGAAPSNASKVRVSANGVTVTGGFNPAKLDGVCLTTTCSNSTNGSTSATACNSYLWTANGQTYTASGTYTHTSVNATGCVNTATLTLTVNSSSTNGNVTTSACNSYTWAANGLTYTATGVYTHTSLNQVGCVNTATLNLTINSSLCCSAVFNGLIFKDPTGANISTTAIVNGGTYSIGALTSPFNIEALFTGNMESVRFTLSGSASSSNVENVYTWDYGGTGSTWQHGAGTFTLLVEAFQLDSAMGTMCTSATVHFTLVGCDNLTSGGSIGNNESGCGAFNPSNIVNLTSPSGGSGTIEYIWLQSFDGGSNHTVIVGATNDSYDPGVITQTTWYRRCARRAGCSDFAGESNWVMKELTLCAPTYPGAPIFISTEEFINKVQFNTISNISGNNGGYGNFTTMSTTVVKGTTVPITLTAGFVGSTRTEYWKVWIDWNYDGDWADANEMVASGTSSGTTPVTLNVAVPTTAVSGYPLRMRTIMRRSGYATDPVIPSGTLKGEVEDYTVITSATARTIPGSNEMHSANSFQEMLSLVQVYPNPVAASEQEINLQYSLVEGGTVSIALYTIDGKLLSTQKFDGQQGENRNKVLLPALANGNYNLVVSFGNEKQTHKFLVR
jgi:hypothetical protein